MHKVLLLGSTGLLGSAFMEALQKSQIYELLAPKRDELELRSFLQVSDYIQMHKPDIIINCAGYNLVDQCEIEEHEQVLAQELNVDIVKQLSILAKQTGAYFLTFSSDYVFDGNQEKPYLETDSPSPLNFYGQTKLKAEIACINNNDASLVIRTSWLFGPSRPNFVSSIVKKLQSADPVAVVDDQVGCPTYSLDLVNFVIEKVLKKKYAGILHVTNAGSVSWFEFAQEIAKCIESDKEILRLSSEQLNRLATRPKSSILASERIGPLRDFRLALAEYIKLSV